MRANFKAFRSQMHCVSAGFQLREAPFREELLMCLSPASQEQLFLPSILQFTVFVAFNFTLTFCLFLNKLSWLNNSFYHELSGLFSGHDCHFVLLAGLSQWRIATLHRKNECGKTLSGLTLEWVPVCQLLRSFWPFFVLHFIFFVPLCRAGFFLF